MGTTRMVCRLRSSSWRSPLAAAMILAGLNVALAAAPARAQSQGPNFPTTVVNDPAVGTLAWENPEGAAVSDDNPAFALLGNEAPNTVMNYLKATDFGFAIPASAVIEGIEVLIERQGVFVSDAGLYLVKGGVVGGADRSALGEWTAFPDTIVPYGGSNDLWGETWTAADINDPGFGFAMSLTHNMSGLAAIDSISIRVFYNACGNGQIDLGEDCEDGNVVSGDCCSPTCQFDAPGAPCPDGTVCNGDEICDGAGGCDPSTAPDCDDDNVCTQDFCHPVNGCVTDASPVAGCRTSLKSILIVKNKSPDTKDKLVWKWLKGAETSLEDLGLPTGTTNYTLCLYAGTISASVAIPAGSSWKAVGTKGFKFKDTSGVPDGAQKALLKSGAAGKAKALVKGKGVNLPDDLAPMLQLPVTAQLVNDTNNVCYGAEYVSAIKNDSKQFKAKQ